MMTLITTMTCLFGAGTVEFHNPEWTNAMLADARLEQKRDTNTVYEMTPFATREAWEKTAEALRSRILIACGLYPLPERTPLNPLVTGRTEHPDYIVENVALEALPGFYVTGNLYRPTGEGPFPAVACPHGHWEKGRFENTETCSVAGRCITFARMGIVAFSYDMVGYNDSRQFAKSWGHSPEGIPLEERRRQALWGIHPFGVQLWSSMRVLDFLESLPFVDKDRLACTGASGGGTQTFALAAVDPRVKVSAPVNMISHTMQGGCMCENAPLIRFDVCNMEIGALMAPRPMLMVSATGDWTKKTPEVEFPAIRGIYALYDAADRVENHHVDAGHNYNRESREAVYRFLGKWLLNSDRFHDFAEPPFEVEQIEVLRVFADDQLPSSAKTQEEIISDMIASAKTRWGNVLPKTPAETANFKQQFGDALRQVLSISVPLPNEINIRTIAKRRAAGIEESYLVLGRKEKGEAFRAILFRPLASRRVEHAVVLVTNKNLEEISRARTVAPFTYVRALLNAHVPTLLVEPFLTSGKGERQYAKFPDTFVPTDTMCRIQDIVTAVKFLRSQIPAKTHLVGLQEAGMWCLFAGAIDDDIASVLVDMNHFDTTDDAAWVQKYYVPCIRNVGDVLTACALIAPRRLTLFNVTETFDRNALQRFSTKNRIQILQKSPTVIQMIKFMKDASRD